MKKALLITSLCAFGRAGLYPQILAFERAGIQSCPLPSVVLSTHTGGLGAPARSVLTQTVKDALEHYLSLGLRFDALLTGYLPDPSIADAILGFVERGGADFYVCDPAMADGGRLYGGMDDRHAAAMRRLVSAAAAITPNVTEAAILLGREPSGEYEPSELSRALSTDTRAAIVTGGGDERLVRVSVAGGGSEGEIEAVRAKGRFIGTGDMFAAELTAAMLDGSGALDAARRAVRAVSAAVELSGASADNPLFGMPTEGARFDR